MFFSNAADIGLLFHYKCGIINLNAPADTLITNQLPAYRAIIS